MKTSRVNGVDAEQDFFWNDWTKQSSRYNVPTNGQAGTKDMPQIRIILSEIMHLQILKLFILYCSL